MPIDQSTPPAAGTTRRTFLVRSAVGGAIAAAGVAAPVAGLLPFAGPIAFVGAQDGEPVIDADYAGFAAPLELAAVQAYEQALDTGLLDTGATTFARTFQAHHQSVAGSLAELLDGDAPTPAPDAQLTSQVATQIAGASDAAGLATVLAALEETLAATHLAVIPDLRDPITARLLSQVAAVESQQATVLGLAGAAAIPALTPAEATTEGAIAYAAPPRPDAEADDNTTTTTSGD